jgi:Fur family ferric uptake transcriptional regulator
MGIVSRLDFGDARSRYELVERSGKPSHHHHLVCSSCKRVVEYDDFMDEEVKLIKKLEKALSRKHGFGITGHVVQFLGLCPACKTLARA